jgi:hypothetical protein
LLKSAAFCAKIEVVWLLVLGRGSIFSDEKWHLDDEQLAAAFKIIFKKHKRGYLF